jgi:hypothetical protein
MLRILCNIASSRNTSSHNATDSAADLGVSGLTFVEAWSDRLEQTIDRLRLPFLGRASLIRNKEASGRQKDLGDIESLGEWTWGSPFAYYASMMSIHHGRRSGIAVLVILGALGCSKLSTMPVPPGVAFKYDAPFCGTALIEKSIDHVVVGTDSMVPGKASRFFTVAVGNHVLGARRLGTINGQQTTIYTWPDTTVTSTADSAITRVLSLYCS